MIVHVASPTTFHAVDLAVQMARLEQLGFFYTGLPPSMTTRLAEKNVCRQSLLLAPQYLARKLKSNSLHAFFSWTLLEWFDQWVSSQVQPCDIFHSLSGFGLHSHQVVKSKYGALTVCDRGSSHIVYQNEILREEYARLKIPYREIDKRAIEKELAEYSTCDLITVPSTFAFGSFIKHGIPVNKLAQIPYGVDLHDFRPVPKEDDVFRVLFVGQVSVRKGLVYLLQALETLHLPKFELVLIGNMDSEMKDVLAKYHIEFKYLGPKPRADLYRFYSQSSVFVLPSVEEGLALVMAQAMACGVPVIATTHTGAEDLFEDGKEGFIVPIRNPIEIREKILFLYEHPDMQREMARAAKERVRFLGGWNAYGMKMLEVYEMALGNR